jgi:hypothetical protein
MEYQESNCRAIVRPKSGVIYFLPVGLNQKSEAYVKFFDRYVKPQEIQGYERMEVLPQFRKEIPA